MWCDVVTRAMRVCASTELLCNNGSGEKQLILLLSRVETAYCWSAVRKLFITAGQQCASSLLLLVSSGLTHFLLFSSAERTKKPLTHSRRLGAQQSPDLLQARLAGPGDHGQCLPHRTPSSTLSLPYLDNTTLGGKEQKICGF